MRKILLITVATSSILMGAHHHYKDDAAQQAAWAAWQSYYYFVPDKNGCGWINGVYYTPEGLAHLTRIATTAHPHEHKVPNTPPSQALRVPTNTPRYKIETTWEILTTACASMHLALPQNLKTKVEEAIQTMEDTPEEDDDIWAHISMGYASSSVEAKKHFLNTKRLCRGRQHLSFEWKVATIGLINTLFQTGEVLRALFLLHKFRSDGKNMVQSKRLLILSALDHGWEERLRETDWMKHMDDEYPNKTIAEIKKAIKFFERDLFPDD